MSQQFPTSDANFYEAEREGRFALYRTGTNDTTLPGYLIDDPSDPHYPQYPGYSGSVPWTLNLYPKWHFYGERAGETGSFHNGHVVVESDGAASGKVVLSIGILVSDPNFDPLNNNYDLPTVRLTMPNGSVNEYYVIENGWDFTLREANRDPAFSLDTEFYHPMLVDGTLYDIQITDYDEDSNVFIARVKSQSKLSTLVAENRLRPQITLAKELLDENYDPVYARDAYGSVKTASSRFRDTARSVSYNLRPDDEYTVHAEIRIDPVQTPVLDISRVYAVRYPAYLDQMLAEGTITEDELDAYIAYDLGIQAGTYEIGGVSYGNGSGAKTGGRQPFTGAGAIRVNDLGHIAESVDENGEYMLYTLLTADITLNANQHVRIFNVPEDSLVRFYETDIPAGSALTLYDWETPTHENELYGSAAAIAGVGIAGNEHAMSAYTVDTDSYDGFEQAVASLNANYNTTVYNRRLPIDLELKKIDAVTTARDTVTLSDSTTPSGSGQMYDDSRIPGLPGARFTLYRQMEPEVPVGEMAAAGLAWLKPDGTLSAGARPSEASVQVFPARDSNGDPVRMSNAGVTDSNGRLRFYSLMPGTYYLVETTAPEGYMLDNPSGGTGYPVRVVISGDGATYIMQNFNVGVPQSALTRVETGTDDKTVHEILLLNARSGDEFPETGGSGSRWQTALGLTLFFGACALLIKRKTRREEG